MTIYNTHDRQDKFLDAFPAIMAVVCFALAVVAYYVL